MKIGRTAMGSRDRPRVMRATRQESVCVLAYQFGSVRFYFISFHLCAAEMGLEVRAPCGKMVVAPLSGGC